MVRKDKEQQQDSETYYAIADDVTELTLTEPACFEEPVTVLVTAKELRIYRNTGLVSLRNVVKETQSSAA